MKRVIILITFLISSWQSLGQDKFTNGLSLKAGLKRELLQKHDQRLSLPEVEISKQWSKRWHTSVDFSTAKKGDEDYYGSTGCADLNVLYSVHATKHNIVKAGTGISYRYLRSEKLVSYSEDQYGFRSDKKFELYIFSGPGINIMIEDEFTVYRSISFSARAGYQYYGPEMRSYMMGLKVGYRF